MAFIELLSAIFGGLALIPAYAGYCCWLKIIIASSNNMENIHANLTHQWKKLHAKRDCHIRSVQERVTMMPTETYDKWVAEVRNIECEVEEINTEYQTQSKKSKWFRFWARSNFSQRLTKMRSNIIGLIEEEEEEDEKCGLFLVEKELEKVVKMHPPDIKEFSTLQNALENIVKFVEDENHNCMVVWGKLGMGKTAIIENLNNHEKVDELFDLVICLNVSAKVSENNFSIEKMQQDIVRRLKLKVEVNSHVEEEVALTIKEKLSDKKYLLLLIDVKEDIELLKIGIDLKNGSKIVLTTTDKRVRCSMPIGKVKRNVIQVEYLTGTDALKMFKSALEDWEHKENPIFKGVMVEVVNMCCGHPLAIRTVARSFRMRDTLESWKEGLENLRIWPVKGEGSLKQLYDFLNFSCNQLKDYQKDCFLYSAIYPEDRVMHTDWLLDCWAAEKLYRKAGECDNADAEKVRVEVRIILDHLKRVHLLEECVRKECVRMHKLIRQAALCRLSHKHLVKRGSLPLDAQEWKDKKYISWGACRLNSLPELQDKLIVSTLLLQENSCLKRIRDDSFFECMESLLVLNLSCTRIESLPTSVSKLNHLKVLYLNGCSYLENLPPQIGDLNDLEVLDLRGSGVKSIPCEMKNLSKLRRLLLSLSNFGSQNEQQAQFQSCKAISKILSLEELIMDAESTERRASLNGIIDAVASPLKKLMTFKFCFKDGEEYVIRLEAGTLTFNFPSADDFKNFVYRVEDLDKFHVFIGHSNPAPQNQNSDENGYKRCLSYCGGRRCGNTTISNILANSDAIELVNHNDIKHLSEFGTENMKEIQDCLIEGCNNIERVVDGDCIRGNQVLGKLLRLYMKKLPQLKSICKDPLQGSLSNLMTLEIRECSRIEELLLVEPGEEVLPNLRKLILVDIEKLKRICASVWTASTLEELEIHGCPVLTELPFNIDSATRLGSIKAEESWWEALQWKDPHVKERLSALLLP